MIKSLKGRFAGTQNRAILLGAVVFAAVCLLVGFTRAPHLYPVDYGQYEPVLLQCGLTWTEEDLALGDLQYSRPLTSFQYTHFSWSNLLTPDTAGSTVYVVALVRLFTQPLGLYFSVDAMAFVWAVILAFSTGLLTVSLRRMLPRAWMVPGMALCVLFTDGNFCAIFRGLYPQSAAIAFSLLYGAVLFYAWSLPAERRRRWLFPALLCSLLMLKASTALIVFLPFVIGADAALLLSCQRKLAHRALSVTLFLVILLTGCSSAVHVVSQDQDLFSNAAAYESVFNTLLPASDVADGILYDWGLDASYGEDIGKSFYEPEEAYAHCPRQPEEADILFAHINTETIVSSYLNRPWLFFQAMAKIPTSLNNGFESGRNRSLQANEKQFTAVRSDIGVISLLWKLLPLSWAGYLCVQIGLGVFFLVYALQKRPMLGTVGCLLALGCAAYLPFCVMLNGYAQSQQYMLFQVFLVIMLLAGFLCAAVYVLPVVTQWMTKYMRDAYTLPAERQMAADFGAPGFTLGQSALGWVSGQAGHRWRVTLFTALLALGALFCIFLRDNHPVSINNGDFGRMMEQMGLTWSGIQYFDTKSQAGRRAIEEFAYLSSFEPIKLTPLSPTYSLYWFASLVRLLTQPFGMPFSTLLLAWIMGLISVVCVTVIVWDLYPLLKKWTLAAALLLCAMVFSETYLTWYNSLYGEGCILLGMLLTLMCALRLCMMPRTYGWKQFLWFIGLFLSLNILVTAKSQMLMAAPGAILLLLAMAWYQRPYRYDFQALHALLALALCFVLAVSGVGVYQSDRTTDSVSQKHTMWQAYFYGIFMISDDPIGDMEALGIDTAMAPDIGKYVDFSADAEYVYAPLSDEAQTAFHDHVSMFTILQWYLTHPAKLFLMLDHAASQSRTLYTGFRIYNGQDYNTLDHDDVDGWNLWPGWRAYLTPGFFLGYVVIYGVMLFLLLRIMLRKTSTPFQRILCCVPLFLMITGVLQFPLSVLGNGFADNQKQLFCFSLCHDLLLGGVIILGARKLFDGFTWPAFIETFKPEKIVQIKQPIQDALRRVVFQKKKTARETRGEEEAPIDFQHKAEGHQEAASGQGAEKMPRADAGSLRDKPA